MFRFFCFVISLPNAPTEGRSFSCPGCRKCPKGHCSGGGIIFERLTQCTARSTEHDKEGETDNFGQTARRSCAQQMSKGKHTPKTARSLHRSVLWVCAPVSLCGCRRSERSSRDSGFNIRPRTRSHRPSVEAACASLYLPGLEVGRIGKKVNKNRRQKKQSTIKRRTPRDHQVFVFRSSSKLALYRFFRLFVLRCFW